MNIIKCIYIVLIISFANDFYDLTPRGFIPGLNQISDIGILLIFLGLIYYVLRGDRVLSLLNFFTFWVFFYLLLVLVQVSIASFYYSQSVVEGLVVARHQFYYLSFPLFMMMIDDVKDIKIIVKLLFVLGVVIFLLTLVNYFGPTIFYHQRAEGHGERAGVIRAYVPAMEIFVFCAIWYFWKYLSEEKLYTNTLIPFFLMYGVIVFRQTRGYIISVSLVILMMLFFKRKFKLMVGFSSFLVLIFAAKLTFFPEYNILVSAFESTYTDVTEGEGTWRSRMELFENSWNVFINNFFTGSGGLVIGGDWREWRQKGLFDVAHRADLGYWVWLKAYGLPGIILLTAMFVGFFNRILKAMNAMVYGEHRMIILFIGYFFTSIVISLVTLTYLTSTRGIVMICLSWAILLNMIRQYEELNVTYEAYQPQVSARFPGLRIIN